MIIYKILAILFSPYAYLLSKPFKLFGFSTFRLWAHQMKVILKTRRAHYIWYLRFLSTYQIQVHKITD